MRLILLVVLASCSSDADPVKQDRPAPVEPVAPIPPPLPAVAPPPSAAAVEAEARTLLDRWLKSQNEGRFDDYQALYHATRFTGIKRTASGSISKYDAPRWRADRKRMFAGAQTVAADEIAVRTWLSPNTPALPVGVTEVSFLQRWKNERYADHGSKVIRLLREADRQWIVYEDMMTSAPGFDPSGSWTEVDALVRELEPLSPDQRRARLTTLDRAAVENLIMTRGCHLALEAAQARQAIGDASLLPRRDQLDQADPIARALCLIGAMEKPAERLAFLADYLPPTGKVTLTQDLCPDEDGEEDEEAERTFTRASATGDEIDHRFGGDGLAVCRPAAQGAYACTGIGNAEEMVVTLARHRDGKLYISTIETHRLTGCGC